MKTFSVRLEDDVFEKLEATRGKKPRVDYLREVIETHLNEPKRTKEDIQRLQDIEKEVIQLTERLSSKDNEIKKEVIQLNEMLSSKDNEIKTLNESLGRAYNEMRWFQEEIRRVNDRILALAPSVEERKEKSWWQFWK
jgi:chromosome segregation ATPase